MLRVGFSFEMTGSWIGGVNYFRSLIGAIVALPGRKIEPVIFAAAPDVERLAREFPDVEILATTLLRRKSLPWLARRLIERAAGREYLFERLLKRQRIDVLSHSGTLGPGASIPTIGWIADLQHRRLPDLCSAAESAARDAVIARWARECTALMFSSESARRDFERFYEPASIPVFVIPFVPLTQPVAAAEASRAIAQYRLPPRYFYIPNQFWAHKNHRLVIEAARLLHERGDPVDVVFTGGAQDYRNPRHYADLVELAAPLAGHAHFLGVVPYADVLALMEGALAVINPSRFEGWSTTVEEARNLGKSILLSDIDVHREQAPARGVYFDPDKPEDLAGKMWAAWQDHEAVHEEALRQRSLPDVEGRRHAFGAAFQDMVFAVHGKERRNSRV